MGQDATESNQELARVGRIQAFAGFLTAATILGGLLGYAHN
jgi:hypothetical protein